MAAITQIGPDGAVAPRTGRRPPVGPLVGRPRLLRRLTGARAPLAVLHAPAGYGKTALLRQWDDADPREFAWLALDGPGADPAAATDRVRHQLARHARGRVLVLDGAQALADPGLLGFVADVALCQDAESTIVVATRGEPALPLGTLRVRDAVVELDAHDLAFTRAEVDSALQASGLDLAPPALDALCRVVAGWPAGVRLAALAACGRPEAVAGFGGDDRLVSDYLREAVLADLPDEVQAFLCRVAPLGELSGPLCDALLERAGSAELLRSLARSERMVTAADRAERSFRLHPLLAGALCAELDRVDPEAAPRLHGRASVWHEAEGDVPRALDHAIGARDTTRAGELLWRLARTYATTGRAGELRPWLDRLGEAAAEQDPGIALTTGVERLANGDRDGAERWADAAAGCRVAPDRSWQAGLAVVEASLARGNARRLLAQARSARTAAGSSAWRSDACLLEGMAQRLLGDPDAARRALVLAARGDGGRPTMVRAHALAGLALLELERDDVDGALVHAEGAVEAAVAVGAEREPAGALVHATAARVHAQAGEVEQARTDVDRARALLAGLVDPAPWYAAETSIALACALLRLSDAPAARELLAVAARALGAVPDADGLRAALEDAWERVDSFAIDAIAGTAALTIAELRVLRFLPTHLSFREIAARLHVSANTVKTQAHAVYRKLGASSRSEAVAHATTIGLIGS